MEAPHAVRAVVPPVVGEVAVERNAASLPELARESGDGVQHRRLAVQAARCEVVPVETQGTACMLKWPFVWVSSLWDSVVFCVDCR